MPKDSPNPLAKLVNKLVTTDRFKTRRAIALAIGMTDSSFSRAVNDEGRLTVEQCIKLAGVLGEDPAAVLRESGRADLAKVIGPRAAAALTRWEMEVLGLWRLANASQQQAIYSVLSMIVHAPTAPTGSRRSGAALAQARRNRADETAVAAERKKRRLRAG